MTEVSIVSNYVTLCIMYYGERIHLRISGINGKVKNSVVKLWSSTLGVEESEC